MEKNISNELNKKLELLMQITKSNSIISRKISGHGLAFSDFMILYLLDSSKQKKLRRIDLAELMGLTASGVTRMILPLEKLGIIEREDDESDARARYSKLTKAGKNLLEDSITTITFKTEDLLPNIQNKDINKMINVLYSIKNSG